MANLKDIRKRRKGAQNTKKITRTMELVASAKFRKAMDAALAARPYAEELQALIQRIASRSGKNLSHPLMKARPVKTVLIAVATSDRGLAGAFNANLVNTAIKLAKQHEAQGRKVRFIALGKKAASGIAFAGYPVEAAHTRLVGGALKFNQIEKLANNLIKDFTDNGADLVEIVFSRFLTQSRQEPSSAAMLPAGTGGVSGAEASKAAAGPQGDFIYEPEPEDLFAALIPQMVRFFLFSALLQTTASEHAARRIAMKNATDAASDMIKALTTAYNRGRQGKITQEIAEITGAVEAMA